MNGNGRLMKRFVELLPATLAITIASAAYSQSLADLANKENERRQKITDDVKVFTNADIAKYRSEPVSKIPASLPPSPKEKSEQKKARNDIPSPPAKIDPDEPVDFQGRPESYWRKTMADARQKVKDLANEANALVLKQADLQNQFFREDDGFKREWIQRDIQKTIYEQDQNKENLAKAKEALQDLEKQARKSGALPGWIESRNP
jgi:hypothetical protein